MLLEVNFRVKKYRESWSNQEIKTSIKNVEVEIRIEGVECCSSFSGETDETVWEVFYAVWEVLALYDGYFYEPLFASVDKVSYDIEKIYGMKFRKTDKSWIDSATLLGQENRKIDEDIIVEYMNFRGQGREQGKMTRSLVNAYFYLLSVAYKEINIEHKLSLMLNICDGYYLNEISKSKGTGGHIVNLIGNIGREKVQYGLELMGIPKGKITELFGGVRDEIDHYIIMQFSAGSYIPNLVEAAGRSLNLYLLYIAELSVRVTFLERIHGTISPKAKERAIDSINDWLILKCDFNDKCKLPENRMEQELKKVCASIS